MDQQQSSLNNLTNRAAAERDRAGIAAPSRLLTVQQTATLAGVSASTVRSWLDDGRLKPSAYPPPGPAATRGSSALTVTSWRP
jgi:hypothetical protein